MSEQLDRNAIRRAAAAVIAWDARAALLKQAADKIRQGGELHASGQVLAEHQLAHLLVYGCRPDYHPAVPEKQWAYFMEEAAFEATTRFLDHAHDGRAIRTFFSTFRDAARLERIARICAWPRTLGEAKTSTKRFRDVCWAYLFANEPLQARRLLCDEAPLIEFAPNENSFEDVINGVLMAVAAGAVRATHPESLRFIIRHGAQMSEIWFREILGDLHDISDGELQIAHVFRSAAYELGRRLVPLAEPEKHHKESWVSGVGSAVRIGTPEEDARRYCESKDPLVRAVLREAHFYAHDSRWPPADPHRYPFGDDYFNAFMFGIGPKEFDAIVAQELRGPTWGDAVNYVRKFSRAERRGPATPSAS